MIALGIQNGLRRIRIDAVNADVLDGVAHAADEEVAAQGACQAELRASTTLIEQVAVEPQLAIIQIDAERELTVQEPRLDERNQIILPHRADGHVQPKLLP